MDMSFTAALVPEALEIMLKGMAGIFIALFIIYAASEALQKVFPE